MHSARRLLVLVFVVIFGLGAGAPAWANPQLLVDMISARVLYAEDAGVPWHPASLTKLMTAYVTFEAIADGRVSLDTRVVISQHAINQAPDKSGLPLGDSVTMKDALYIMLVKSANDMAVAIAEAVDGSEPAFVDEMNATARRIGLTGTHYNNANGLPDPGQITTARDLAVLAINIRRTFPQYDPIFATEKVKLGKMTLKTNNDLLTEFAGTNGMKTGYICASGLNILATVKRGNRYLMAVVLGGATSRERNEMAAQMILRGLAGEYGEGTTSVVQIANDTTLAPVNMRPQICGKKAKAFRAARRKAFPLGLKGKPSYLTDKLAGNVYAATDLGPVGSTSGASGDADASQGAVPDVNAPIPMPRLDRG